MTERSIAITSQDWAAKGATSTIISNVNKATLITDLNTWLSTATAGTAKSVVSIVPYYDGDVHNLIIIYYLEQISLIPAINYGGTAGSRAIDEVPPEA